MVSTLNQVGKRLQLPRRHVRLKADRKSSEVSKPRPFRTISLQSCQHDFPLYTLSVVKVHRRVTREWTGRWLTALYMVPRGGRSRLHQYLRSTQSPANMIGLVKIVSNGSSHIELTEVS